MARPLTAPARRVQAPPVIRPVQLVPARRPGPLVLVAVAYLVVVTGVMIWRGISVSPDYLLVIMVPIALVSGRFIRFLGDWVPFIAVFLGWEAMRGIAGRSGIPPHVGDLASVERFLFFGHIPSVSLQSWIHRGGWTVSIDYAATVVYFGHFAVPVIAGMVLWLVNRRQFLRYTTAFMGMATAAFVIFLLVPTAPPWYAQDHGVISGLSKILGNTLPSSVSPYYKSLNPNSVAAFPSLHAAFPFLAYLALRRVYPRAAYVALGWSMLVWFSVVYLGEHYVVDVLAGIALATASWLVMIRVVAPRVSSLRLRPVAVPESVELLGSVDAPVPAPAAARAG